MDNIFYYVVRSTTSWVVMLGPICAILWWMIVIWRISSRQLVFASYLLMDASMCTSICTGACVKPGMAGVKMSSWVAGADCLLWRGKFFVYPWEGFYTFFCVVLVGWFLGIRRIEGSPLGGGSVASVCGFGGLLVSGV